MINKMLGGPAILTALCGLLVLGGPAAAESTTFQYQGRLNDQSGPATGSYDLAFSIYDSSTNGDQVGPVVTNSATAVSNGCFFVALDFGNIFNGNNYWLQVAARTNGDDDFTLLTPRQPITSVPYSILALNSSGLIGSLPVAQLAGTVPLSQLPAFLVTNGSTSLKLSGVFSGNGAGLSGVFASNLITDTSVISVVMTNVAPTPSNNWAFYAMSQNSSNFLTVGGLVDAGANGPGGYYDPMYFQTGADGQPDAEILNAMSETFGMDGSQFVFGILGQGRTFDVIVNGTDNLVLNSVPPDGNPYWFTVTFGTAATRTITLRNAYGFSGVYLPVTNDFFLQRALGSRMVILGDSFTEQTYATASQCAGVVSQLQALLPQFDIWALGEGGTGVVNPGTLGGTNFIGRVGDVIRAAPQFVLIYGGINDVTFATNTDATNPVYINATNLLFSLQAGLPAAKIVVIGPQWPRTPSPVGDSDVFNCGILLSNACSVCAVPYISPISPPWITGVVTTPNSGNADVYTSPTDLTHPTIPAGAKFLANQIVSALSSYWNLSNPANLGVNTSISLLTNGIPTPVPGIGILWNSNNALYWVTTTHTNYISGP
jgi:lysophospholipase L1-like esterase